MNQADVLSEQLKKLYEKLADEESKTIFRGRILNSLREDDDLYFDMLSHLKKQYLFQGQSSPYFKNHDRSERKFILFGGGRDLKRYLQTLRVIGYEASFICDRKKELQGQMLLGVPCISPEKLGEIWRDYFIIISSVTYKDEIYRQLLQMGVSPDHIYQTQSHRLVAWNDRLYFRDDLFQKEEQEVFIDAGAYIGDTVQEFMEWAPDFKKIYAFEPEEASYRQLAENYERENIVCVQAGLGSRAGSAGFRGDRGHGWVTDQGNTLIPIVSIDGIVKDQRVTMIKMDIEGSELEALKGAEHTIVTHYPKLAICLYHKREDIYEIPLYLSQIAPRYQFYIRNISADLSDLILYAVLQEA